MKRKFRYYFFSFSLFTFYSFSLFFFFFFPFFFFVNVIYNRSNILPTWKGENKKHKTQKCRDNLFRTSLSYRVNIHRLFLSSKRVAFFTERLPTYISSYKHYTFHVRHYRFRIPGNFSFFSFLSIYPTKYVCMYISPERICIIEGTRPSVSRDFIILSLFATFIF